MEGAVFGFAVEEPNQLGISMNRIVVLAGSRRAGCWAFGKMFFRQYVIDKFVPALGLCYFCRKLIIMKFIEQKLKGAFIIEPQVFGDSRGYFMESYKKELFDRYIGPVDFIQDNESRSSYGVLRGLHFQRGQWSQAKLVRVTEGRVYDVIVDLRRSSPTFGQYMGVELSDENKRQLFVPRGFAHGFAVLSETAQFCYKVDNVYAPQAEVTLLYNDPHVGVEWPIKPADMLLSEKDTRGLGFEEIEPFE